MTETYSRMPSSKASRNGQAPPLVDGPPLILHLIRVGELVEIGPLADPMQATVVEILIKSTYHVEYRIAWFDRGGARHCELLAEQEVRLPMASHDKLQRIGFGRG
jgi:hypothetical protein